MVCIIDNVLYKQSNNRIKDLHIIDYKSTYREENLKAHTKQLYTYAYALLQNEVFAQVKNIT
ncbi:PD-(D/E)XK nuclease family protein [bacterium]|nr:PD-(D/E)XK nuclease family protein [bacterium]